MKKWANKNIWYNYRERLDKLHNNDSIIIISSNKTVKYNNKIRSYQFITACKFNIKVIKKKINRQTDTPLRPLNYYATSTTDIIKLHNNIINNYNTNIMFIYIIIYYNSYNLRYNNINNVNKMRSYIRIQNVYLDGRSHHYRSSVLMQICWH